MTLVRLELVRAIILGLGEFERFGAPEPDIIGDLAPSFSDAELELAFHILSQATGASISITERSRLVSALLERASELAVPVPPELSLAPHHEPDRSQSREPYLRAIDAIRDDPGWLFSLAVWNFAPSLDRAGIARLLDVVDSYDVPRDPFAPYIDVRSESVIILAPHVPRSLRSRLVEVARTLPRDLVGNRARETVEGSTGVRGDWWPPGDPPFDTPTRLRAAFGVLDPRDRLSLLKGIEDRLQDRDLGGAPLVACEAAGDDLDDTPTADDQAAYDKEVDIPLDDLWEGAEEWSESSAEEAPASPPVASSGWDGAAADFEYDEPAEAGVDFSSPETQSAPAQGAEREQSAGPAESWGEISEGLGAGDTKNHDSDEATGAHEPVGPSSIEPVPSATAPNTDAHDVVPAESIPTASTPERPVVNTGFAPVARPNMPVQHTTALSASRRYYFWLEVGERRPGAIDVEPVSLPTDKLPTRARLTVALFAFEGEIEIEAGADVGELEVMPDGSAMVTRPAAKPGLPGDCELLRTRLFFPVTTPSRRGRYRLRCNLYHRQVLVQSHLVTVHVTGVVPRITGDVVGRVWRSPTRVLASECDYTLTHSLTDASLDGIEAHRLSLMLNSNGDGTHGFRAYGSDGSQLIKQDASFSDLELQDFITRARGALRKAAWGSREPWVDQKYLYEDGNGTDLERLRVDLARLARWGFRFYDAIANRLAASGATNPVEVRDRRQQLEALMSRPGYVQLASKLSARRVVPVALLYDYGIDDTASLASYTLCPEFLSALAAAKPVLETRCFEGDCPSRGEDLVVCPSGFWGFRHRIGLPVSIGGKARDGAFRVPLTGAPELTMAVATDPRFKRRAGHERAVKTLTDDLALAYADTRSKAIELMRRATSHVVYFYCHGGIDNNVPYLEVGHGPNSAITRALISLKKIFFHSVQPLIFINGCHTTALEPETALDLVTGFVENANAAGVIGTEITVFEPLACDFAEPCLRHFLRGETIGEAVRLARLDLLQKGNPLGLVYIPFVVASLALTAADA